MVGNVRIFLQVVVWGELLGGELKVRGLVLLLVLRVVMVVMIWLTAGEDTEHVVKSCFTIIIIVADFY